MTEDQRSLERCTGSTYGCAKRLPDAARSLGRSLRIMKAETKGLIDDDNDVAEKAEPQYGRQPLHPSEIQHPGQQPPPAYQPPTGQPQYQQPQYQQQQQGNPFRNGMEGAALGGVAGAGYGEFEKHHHHEQQGQGGYPQQQGYPQQGYQQQGFQQGGYPQQGYQQQNQPQGVFTDVVEGALGGGAIGGVYGEYEKHKSHKQW